MVAIYSDEMGYSTSVATGSYVAMTGSPYSPKASGRLRKLKLFASGDAATALIEDIAVRAQSASFGGVEVHVCTVGAGIRTAPAFPVPVGETVCDVKVVAGVPITIETLQRTGDTPVTPQWKLIGVFEATKIE